MWFVHVRHADLARAAVDPSLDRLAMVWGSLCCDVDKVSRVPRSTSHYGREGTSFPPESFVEVAGLSREEALRGRSFLAGYLSHLAVDRAWYGAFRRVRAPGERWSADTVRALNGALDLLARPELELDGLSLAQARGHELLPHLRGLAGESVRLVAGAYLGWNGSLDWRPANPLLAAGAARFRALARAQEEPVRQILRRLDPEELDREVASSTCSAVRRFLAALETP